MYTRKEAYLSRYIIPTYITTCCKWSISKPPQIRFLKFCLGQSLVLLYARFSLVYESIYSRNSPQIKFDGPWKRHFLSNLNLNFSHCPWFFIGRITDRPIIILLYLMKCFIPVQVFNETREWYAYDIHMPMSYDFGMIRKIKWWMYFT